MAKKNDTDSATEFLIFIMFIIAIGAFFLIKWTIIGLIFLISSIVVWIINISRKQKRKNYIKKIVETNFKDSILKPVPKITQKELKDKLGLFDIDVYDEMFENKIKPRGQKYFADRKLENAQNKDNVWSCEVIGTEKYDVSIKFDEDKIIETNCTCPYHKEDNKNCKHIYALLIKAKCEWNLPKILEAITDYSKRVNKIIEEETEYIKLNQKSLKLNENDLSTFSNDINRFMLKVKNASKSLENNKYNEMVLLSILIDLIENSYIFNKDVENILTIVGKVGNPYSVSKANNTYNNDNTRLKASDVVLGAAVANEIGKHIHKKDDDYDEELEREMDNYMLEDWQKDLVRKGEYNPWNFEEDGPLEEDDYYYDDDDN